MMVNPEHCHVPDKPGRGLVGESQEVVKLDFFLNTNSQQNVGISIFVLTEVNRQLGFFSFKCFVQS